MFHFPRQQVSQRHGKLVRIESSGKRLTFQEVARLWREGAGFCEDFNKLQAELPQEAFRWELPGLTF